MPDYISRETWAVIVTVLLTVISTVFIGLRLVVRFFMVRNPGKDDLFCFIAGLFNIMETVTLFYEVRYGSGKHVWELTRTDLQNQLLAVYISMPPYILTLGFIKASILCQYRRVFDSVIRRICFGMLVVVTLTTIAFLSVFSFQCTPTKAFWDVTLRGRCINIATINFAFLSINVATDVILIIIPIPIFKNLKLRKAERRSLILIFALGAFAAITCLLRVPYVIVMSSTKDSTYHNHGLIIWSRVELNVAIVCACLPTLRVPLARWFPKMWRRSVETFRLSRHDASEPATERWSDEAGDNIGSLSKEKTNMAVSGHRTSVLKPPLYPAPPQEALNPQEIRVHAIFQPRIEPQPYTHPTLVPLRKISRDLSSVGSMGWSGRPGGGKRVTYSTQASGSQRSSPLLGQSDGGGSPHTEWRSSNVTTLAEVPLFADDSRLDNIWSQMTQDPIWSRDPI